MIEPVGHPDDHDFKFRFIAFIAECPEDFTAIIGIDDALFLLKSGNFIPVIQV